jgi:SAM-dependent methyltransferase
MAKKVSLPIVVPNRVYQLLKKVKRNFTRNPSGPITIDIGGERNIEWAFLSAEIPNGPGEALEFGCEQGYMSLVAAQRGFHVIANDLEPQAFCWKHPSVEFRQGDFLNLALPRNHFDLVIDCSSIEHVGVAGRYGITVDDSEGDIEVMRRIEEVLKPGGKFLMTGPCGKDALLAPWCRVYGPKRLPLLFGNLQIDREAFWRKNNFNQWIECDRQTALTFEPRNHETNPHACAYNLGCFALHKPI